MKKVCLCCAVLLGAGVFSQAQEVKTFSLGLGAEGNMNTRTALAAGGSLSAFYGLNHLFSLGLKGSFNHNFDAIMTVEPEALFRWYALPLGRGLLFFQAGLGSSLIFEDGELSPVLLGELSAGVRFPLGPLFFEPAIRGGYPFIWGLGITAVYRFGASETADILRR